ncbi:periplasmic protein TonB [Gammaproteobacteria bacterium]
MNCWIKRNHRSLVHWLYTLIMKRSGLPVSGLDGKEEKTSSMTVALISVPVVRFWNGGSLAIAGFLALTLHTALWVSIDGVKTPKRMRPQTIEAWLLPATPEPSRPAPARETLVAIPPSPAEKAMTPPPPEKPDVRPSAPPPSKVAAKMPAVSAKSPRQPRAKPSFQPLVNAKRSHSNPPSTPPFGQLSAAQILASRGQMIDSLTQQPTSLYRHSRRRAVNAMSRDYRFATYLEAWRHKVERIGHLNFPTEARRAKLAGDLVLQVSVRADGQLEGVHLLRSSGYMALDEAAQRIIRLAAPFAPFPPDIGAELDVLDITRTWRFQPEGWQG